MLLTLTWQERSWWKNVFHLLETSTRPRWWRSVRDSIKWPTLRDFVTLQSSMINSVIMMYSDDKPNHFVFAEKDMWFGIYCIDGLCIVNLSSIQKMLSVASSRLELSSLWLNGWSWMYITTFWWAVCPYWYMPCNAYIADIIKTVGAKEWLTQVDVWSLFNIQGNLLSSMSPIQLQDRLWIQGFRLLSLHTAICNINICKQSPIWKLYHIIHINKPSRYPFGIYCIYLMSLNVISLSTDSLNWTWNSMLTAVVSRSRDFFIRVQTRPTKHILDCSRTNSCFTMDNKLEAVATDQFDIFCFIITHCCCMWFKLFWRKKKKKKRWLRSRCKRKEERAIITNFLMFSLLF